MPKQNRVTPFSQLIATPERGTLMGNRGCLHDTRQQIRRSFRGRAWILCVLEFKGRRFPIMEPGHYTALFFLDEATALAAGHRPCAECQRPRFNLFRDTWVRANPELVSGPRLSAAELDQALHRERLSDPAAHARCHTLDELPDGVFVTGDEQTACLVYQGRLWRWSPAGYTALALSAVQFPLRVMTPASVVRMLAAGYPVGVHPSAAVGRDESLNTARRQEDAAARA